jgi:transposase-like protein
MSTSKRYSPEVRERAVRLAFEQQGQHESRWAAIGSIAAKMSCAAETLRQWVRQAERRLGPMRQIECRLRTATYFFAAGAAAAGAGAAGGAGGASEFHVSRM